MTVEVKQKKRLTCTEAAEFLGTNVVLLSGLISRGVLTAQPNLLDRRTKLIELADLERLLERGRPARQNQATISKVKG